MMLPGTSNSSVRAFLLILIFILLQKSKGTFLGSPGEHMAEADISATLFLQNLLPQGKQAGAPVPSSAQAEAFL